MHKAGEAPGRMTLIGTVRAQYRQKYRLKCPLILRPPHSMWDAVHATAARATSATEVCKVTAIGAAWQTKNGIRGRTSGETRLFGFLLPASCCYLAVEESRCSELRVAFVPDRLTGKRETCFLEYSQVDRVSLKLVVSGCGFDLSGVAETSPSKVLQGFSRLFKAAFGWLPQFLGR
jgi:hypothetical protein